MTPVGSTPSHLVELCDGWTLWRWTWLRAAGFPARLVLDLAAHDAAAIADQILAVEDDAPLRAQAIEELWRIHHEGAASARVARQAIEHLKLGRLPRPDAALDAQAGTLRALRQREQVRSDLRGRLEDACASALVRTGEVLRVVAEDPRFREAVRWQNRNALRASDWIRAHPDATNTRARQNQQLIANYLQRYALKNDTIGFFGPIAWGDVRRSAVVRAEPGRELLKDRQVHFEHWAIDAVAQAMAAAPDIKPFLAPRLLPSAAVAGTTLRYGFDRSARIPPEVARLLSECDGVIPAYEIARRLVDDPAVEVTSEGEVYEMLEELAERKLVVWTLEPSTVVHPERGLRALLEGIASPEIRARTLGVLARLEEARAEVAAAAGDVPRLDRALAALDVLFEEITGQASTRRSGETYAARTPIYEDCVRDLTLEIGAPVLDRLGPVLALVAHSARWFTHTIAMRYRARLRERFLTLAAGAANVGYLRFLDGIKDLFPGNDQARSSGVVASEVAEELEQRWASILALDLSRQRVELSAAALAEAVRQTFEAPAPGWAGARYVSPDLMIGATSVDAVARGECILILGEVHVGNSLLARLVVPHGPEADDVFTTAHDLDLPEPRIFMVPAREHINRAWNGTPWSPRDLDVEVGSSRSWRDPSHVLRAADLLVEEHAGELVVRHLGSDRRCEIIAFLESYLGVTAIGHFKPVPRGAHVPRVTIDGVVLCREHWRVERDELPAFRTESPGAAQFAGARAWAHQLGLPRCVFIKIPEEPKPVYVDFASPVFVDMFARLLRKASSVTISEMLPTVEETWIPDAEGETYTGELRLVVVDPQAPPPGAREGGA